jgi:hypothetical protein
MSCVKLVEGRKSLVGFNVTVRLLCAVSSKFVFFPALHCLCLLFSCLANTLKPCDFVCVCVCVSKHTQCLFEYYILKFFNSHSVVNLFSKSYLLLSPRVTFWKTLLMSQRKICT